MANIIFSINSNLNNSVYGNSQAPIKALIEKRAEAFEEQSVRPKLFKVIKTNTWAVKFTGMTAMDGPKPVGENGPYPQDGYQEGFSKIIEHDTWKDQFSVTQEMIEDTNFTELAKRPAAFTAAYYRRMEDFAAMMFGGAIDNGAAATAGKASMTFATRKYDLTGADGLPLFATAHPSKTQSGYTQSNRFTGALDETNLTKLETRMQMFTDDDGNILNVAPDTIIIPNIAALKEAAFVAVGSEQKPGGGNNDLNIQMGRWNIIVWPYLNRWIGATNTAPWILMDSKYVQQYDAAVWANRVENKITSYLDESTDANVWKMRCRFGAGFNDWRAFAVANIAGATTI